MLERHSADLDFHATLRDTAHLHPREVVHALGDAVLRTAGGELRDDATVLRLGWFGGSADRASRHGANRDPDRSHGPDGDRGGDRHGRRHGAGGEDRHGR